MAAVAGRAAGFIATLYHSSTAPTTTDSAGLATFAGTANQVIDVSDMGSLENQRDIIDITVYGSDTAGKLAGQADPGTFDFTVTFNADNAKHTTLRGDNGRVSQHWVIAWTQGTDNITYAYFTGFVANATINTPADDAWTMDCSVARDGGVTWVDDT